MDALEFHTDTVLARLAAASQARETALAASRSATRASANAIRALHRGEFDGAAALTADARRLLIEATEALSDQPQIRWAGFVHDAQKEYAEAVLTAAAVRGEPFPSPDEVGVTDVAWLHGIAETVGELRRHCLDRLRTAELDTAERTLATMDDLYSMLVRVDFPDAMTAGLRRATDASRAILERTRSDLSVAVVQDRLERALTAHAARYEDGGPLSAG